MNAKKITATLLLTTGLLLPTISFASESAAREVCKEFISRSGYSVKDWGQSWNWTTIRNSDGTWSVGARFDGMPPGGGLRNLYVTCVAKQSGDQWMLEKITRIQ